ncbi:MAG: hypothetical protein KDD50_08095, partial [Bdellovibrionales bacterium]|nr:hypothetical protein [Bdellovibrionales bacterium]
KGIEGHVNCLVNSMQFLTRLIFILIFFEVFVGCKSKVSQNEDEAAVKNCTLIGYESGIFIPFEDINLDIKDERTKFLDVEVNGQLISDCAEWDGAVWYRPTVGHKDEGLIVLTLDWSESINVKYSDVENSVIDFSVYGRASCDDEPEVLYEASQKEIRWSVSEPNGHGCGEYWVGEIVD